MPDRLYAAKIEAIPKTVTQADTYIVKGILTETQKNALKHIVRCIENGTPLPSRGYYRKSEYRRLIDDMLDQRGYMHLHLGEYGPMVVYLIQYPSLVILLEVSDHERMNDEPVGFGLSTCHEQANVAECHCLSIAISAATNDRFPPSPNHSHSAPYNPVQRLS